MPRLKWMGFFAREERKMRRLPKNYFNIILSDFSFPSTQHFQQNKRIRMGKVESHREKNTTHCGHQLNSHTGNEFAD